MLPSCWLDLRGFLLAGSERPTSSPRHARVGRSGEEGEEEDDDDDEKDDDDDEKDDDENYRIVEYKNWSRRQVLQRGSRGKKIKYDYKELKVSYYIKIFFLNISWQ